MADTASPSATYDSPLEGEQSAPAFTQMWLDALSRATSEERDWRKEAEEAIDTYRGRNKTGRTFNILYANVETTCPAIYNSTPEPDVRRRYQDDDEVGKIVSDVLERSLAYSIDGYDFDAVVKSVLRDGELVGRGVPRVRYVPVFGNPLPDQPGLQEVIYETVECDYVPWKYFRRGPGRQWKDVPWVAFGDFLTKDDVRALNPEIADKIPYDYSSGPSKEAGAEEETIFRRALVWQIWDKTRRRVISICDGYGDEPVAVQEDPLDLTGFFPIPRPYQPITAPDSLTPVVPYSVYKDLADELNEVTSRINRLVRQVRPRGMYGGNETADIEAWATAGDGELVPATNVQFAEGNMQNLIAWFPLEPVVKALQSLIVHREQLKQTIYEVMGIGDILRGASNANETATAQNIKSQWGSLRIQDRQAEVARMIRDLFRIKAEIIATKFSWQTLSQMTGINVPTAQERDMAKHAVQQYQMAAQQAQQMKQPAPPAPPNAEAIKKAAEGPSREEVEQLLRDDVLRAYRVDVESDSTIRGDLSRNQQNMTMFLSGTAQFAQAMGPIIAQYPESMGVVLELYSAFSRQFKLGRQAESALDGLADSIKKTGGNPKPDPKKDAVAAKAQADMQKAQMDMQSEAASHKMEMEQMQAKAMQGQQDFALEQQKFEMEKQKFALEQQRAMEEFALEQQRAAWAAPVITSQQRF